MMNKGKPSWLGGRCYGYLATPYSKYPGGIEAAHDAACRLAARLIDAGWPIFCPISHTHVVAKHMAHDPRDAEFWIGVNAGPLMWSSAMIVAMLPGWDESVGIALEAEDAVRRGVPVIYLDPETLEWSYESPSAWRPRVGTHKPQPAAYGPPIGTP